MLSRYKSKFECIKLGETEINQNLENTYKPITQPLKKIVDLPNGQTNGFLDVPIKSNTPTKRQKKIKKQGCIQTMHPYQ